MARVARRRTAGTPALRLRDPSRRPGRRSAPAPGRSASPVEAPDDGALGRHRAGDPQRRPVPDPEVGFRVSDVDPLAPAGLRRERVQAVRRLHARRGQARAAELSAAAGWGPTARVGGVARGWSELGRAMSAAGAARVRDLGAAGPGLRGSSARICGPIRAGGRGLGSNGTSGSVRYRLGTGGPSRPRNVWCPGASQRPDTTQPCLTPWIGAVLPSALITLTAPETCANRRTSRAITAPGRPPWRPHGSAPHGMQRMPPRQRPRGARGSGRRAGAGRAVRGEWGGGLPGLRAAAVRAVDRRGHQRLEHETAIARVHGGVRGRPRLATASLGRVLDGGRFRGRLQGLSRPRDTPRSLLAVASQTGGAGFASSKHSHNL